jgi:hypothetical protein
MNVKWRMLAALFALFMLAALAVPASANPGLEMSGTFWNAEVVPGNNYTHRITISTEEIDPAMDLLVDVRGLGQTPQGAIQALEASEDTSPYSARSFITLDKSSIHLEPGDSQEVVATLRVPEDATAGGRYAVIYLHTQPMGEGQVGIITAINVLVYLIIKDSQLAYEGKITGLPTAEVVTGEPVTILTNFQNTGNYHFKIKGEVTVKNSQGKVLDKISIPVTKSSVVPAMTWQLAATFIPPGELPPGSYSVQSKVMLEDGTVLDEASGSFEVKEPYVPPAPPASITLTPNSPATLQTADGRISISFPQGSVTGQTEISMQSYPPAQLPSPQAGLEMGNTCFRVDGLTGLLVKEATITVKYSSADLDKAEGDASKLQLARWDEAQSAWSVLSTSVNAEAMTLSAETNQLSIWAVMVGSAPPAPPAPPTPPTSGTMNLMPIIGGVAAVIIIGLLIYLLAVRRRGAY